MTQAREHALLAGPPYDYVFPLRRNPKLRQAGSTP